MGRGGGLATTTVPGMSTARRGGTFGGWNAAVMVPCASDSLPNEDGCRRWDAEDARGRESDESVVISDPSSEEVDGLVD